MDGFSIIFSKLSNLWDRDFIVGSLVPTLIFAIVVGLTLGYALGWAGTLAWIDDLTIRQLAVYSLLTVISLVCLGYVMSGLRELMIKFWSGQAAILFPIHWLLDLNAYRLHQRALKRTARLISAIGDDGDFVQTTMEIDHKGNDESASVRATKVKEIVLNLNALQDELNTHEDQKLASMSDRARKLEIRSEVSVSQRWFVGIADAIQRKALLARISRDADQLRREMARYRKHNQRLQRLLNRAAQSNSMSAENSKKVTESSLALSSLLLPRSQWLMLDDGLLGRLTPILNEIRELRFPVFLAALSRAGAGARFVLSHGAALKQPTPTNLGNIIATYVGYPDWTLGLEGEGRWPALRNTIEGQPGGAAVIGAIADRRLALDFSVTLATLLAALAVVFLLFSGFGILPATIGQILAIGVLLLIPLAMTSAGAAAQTLGDAIRAAYNLYHPDLRRKLLGRPTLQAPQQSVKDEDETAVRPKRSQWVSLFATDRLIDEVIRDRLQSNLISFVCYRIRDRARQRLICGNILVAIVTIAIYVTALLPVFGPVTSAGASSAGTSQSANSTPPSWSLVAVSPVAACQSMNDTYVMSHFSLALSGRDTKDYTLAEASSVKCDRFGGDFVCKHDSAARCSSETNEGLACICAASLLGRLPEPQRALSSVTVRPASSDPESLLDRDALIGMTPLRSIHVGEQVATSDFAWVELHTIDVKQENGKGDDAAKSGLVVNGDVHVHVPDNVKVEAPSVVKLELGGTVGTTGNVSIGGSISTTNAGGGDCPNCKVPPEHAASPIQQVITPIVIIPAESKNKAFAVVASFWFQTCSVEPYGRGELVDLAESGIRVEAGPKISCDEKKQPDSSWYSDSKFPDDKYPFPLLRRITQETSAKLFIVGNADESGMQDENKRLADRRSDAIRTLLLQRKVREDRLEPGSFGESLPIYPLGDHGFLFNRRVDIVAAVPAEEAEKLADVIARALTHEDQVAKKGSQGTK